MPTSDGPSPDALTSTPSGSAEGSVRRRLVPLSVVVLVVGLLLSAGVAWAVAASNERDEQRLLGVQVEQGRAYVASVVQNLTLRLAATAEVASATGAAPASFDAAASRDVGSHEVFASLSLWRVGSHGRVEVAAVGGTPEAAATGQLPDLLARHENGVGASDVVSYLLGR